MHGGGFRNGDRKDPRLGERIPKCRAARVALISVEYRLLKDAGDVKPPVRVCMDDVTAAIRFVRSKAKEWNIDLSRIGLTGSSAGAHAVLYASLTGDNEFGIRAVYTQYPQTSIDPKEMREWIPNSNYGAHLFGYPDFQTWLDHREEVLPWIEKYSPAGLLRRRDPQRDEIHIHVEGRGDGGEVHAPAQAVGQFFPVDEKEGGKEIRLIFRTAVSVIEGHVQPAGLLCQVLLVQDDMSQLMGTTHALHLLAHIVADEDEILLHNLNAKAPQLLHMDQPDLNPHGLGQLIGVMRAMLRDQTPQPGKDLAVLHVHPSFRTALLWSQRVTGPLPRHRGDNACWCICG